MAHLAATLHAATSSLGSGLAVYPTQKGGTLLDHHTIRISLHPKPITDESAAINHHNGCCCKLPNVTYLGTYLPTSAEPQPAPSAVACGHTSDPGLTSVRPNSNHDSLTIIHPPILILHKSSTTWH